MYCYVMVSRKWMHYHGRVEVACWCETLRLCLLSVVGTYVYQGFSLLRFVRLFSTPAVRWYLRLSHIASAWPLHFIYMTCL